MILEGVVTTINVDGGTNIAPMGPVVDATMARLGLRPFPTSTTYANLVRHRAGVFHVTDDVLLIAQAAVGQPDPVPDMRKAASVDGRILTGACRWYEFRVEQFNEQAARPRLDCRVVEAGRLRDFFGFNRAKHAVIEAAILATRTRLLPPDEIRAGIGRLAPIVRKTGGEAEFRAFSLLDTYITRELTP